MGAREGFNGLVNKALRAKGKSIAPSKLNKLTALFMLVTSWVVATLDPSILGMIETLGGPIIAMLLFIMPMYAIRKVPAMRKYAGHLSNLFVVVIGLIAISAVFYNLYQLFLADKYMTVALSGGQPAASSVGTGAIPACTPVFFIAVLFLPPAIFLTAFFTAGGIIFVRRILFWYLFNISVLYDTSITQVINS